MLSSTKPLVDELLDVIDGSQVADPTLVDELNAVRSRLSGPLRIVLAGRVSSGKSTLLNALLNQKIAPTDASECTETVTWFEYGRPEQVQVRLTDGTVQEMRLGDDGLLPANLGVPNDRIRDLRVSLTNDVLRSFTLVDTPGFSSGRPDADQGAEDEIMDRRSREAAANCDAMVFVLNQTLRADELQVLRSFQHAQQHPASAVNAIGALTKADKLSTGDADPLEAGKALAKRYAARHSTDVADVVPVFGLLAETSETGALTDLDVDNLARISELDTGGLEQLMSSVDRFLGDDPPCPVSSEVRSRLLDKLDLFGVQTSFELIRDGATSAGALGRELSQMSGVEQLRSSLLEGFAERAVPLRLLWALDTLRVISYRHGMPPDFGQVLRDTIERIRFDEAMHEVREMEAFQKWCAGEVELSLELEEDLRRLALGRDPVLRLGADDDSPEALRRAAQAGVARWRAARLHGSSANDEVARTVVRSYALALAAGERR